MTANTDGFSRWLRGRIGVDILLGLASIPFTMVLTSHPSSLEMSPVLVAGFVSGLYYETQSRSVGRAGFRTGVVGSLPVFWTSVNFVASEISASLDIQGFAVVVGALWVVFVMAINGFGAALCAIVGGWVSRTVTESAERDD